MQFLYHVPTKHFLRCSKSFSLTTPQDAPNTSPGPPMPETYVQPQNAFRLLTPREFRSRSCTLFYYRTRSFLSRTRQGICMGGGYFPMLITCPSSHTHTSPAPPFTPKCRHPNIHLRSLLSLHPRQAAEILFLAHGHLTLAAVQSGSSTYHHGTQDVNNHRFLGRF